MLFIEPNDLKGNTNYNAPVPEKYRHLLIPGFLYQFVTGTWGSYLSLWLEMDVFTFWLHHFTRIFKGRMMAKVTETIYTINHMLIGRAIGLLNESIPVVLAPDRSHFFIIPSGSFQYVTLEKGYSIAMHIDYKRKYLDSKKQHYFALQPLLDQYDQFPERALHHNSVLHNYQVEHTWRKVYEMLSKIPDPVLFLEGQARELLRLHYEQMEASQEMGIVSSLLVNVKPEYQQAVQEARRIIETDIGAKYSINELARKVCLNTTLLKRLFREFYGLPIYQYLLSLRLSFAKELLLSTNLDNNEIALQCGMKSGSHFAQRFRKKYDITPQAFRKRERDNH